jgi:hypothetical protein
MGTVSDGVGERDAVPNPGWQGRSINTYLGSTTIP